MYWNEYKKTATKNTIDEYRYFLESNFVGVNRLFVWIYLNQNNDVKRYSAKNYYLTKGIIYNYNVIINEKNFYDQIADSNIKRYK